MKIVILKLAAIGDVALACRALRDFSMANETGSLEIHWIIDSELRSLAAKLMEGTDLRIIWHSVSAHRLFSGTILEKLSEAVKILKTLVSVRPRFTILLHRDWRHYALFRAFPIHKIISIDRSPDHELDVYAKALANFARSAKLAGAKKNSFYNINPHKKGAIGLLVGGASNAKVHFVEKRWPKFAELAALILQSTGKKVILFGGPEDQELADAILKELARRKIDLSKVENKVGKTRLENLPADLANLESFVSADSGLAHIAAAVMHKEGQSVITLFGPTSPALWAPRGTGKARTIILYMNAPCSPCYKNDGNFRPCPYSGERFQFCMTTIDTKAVADKLGLDF